MSGVVCPRAEVLGRFLQGRLSGEQAETVAEHLQQCAHCLEKAQQIDGECLRLPTSLPWAAERQAVEELASQLKALCPAAEEGAATPHERAVQNLALRAAAALRAADRTQAVELLAAPQEPGEIGRIGSYRIVRVLGAGGMGIVFEARQEQPHRTVALKMILAGPHPGSERLARFRAETEVVARLQHPGIVQIHAVGEHEGLPFFTMEYVEGGSLAQQLSMAPLAPRPAAELVEALARAVQYAHEQGFVHRDLKPSNVLLSRPAGGGDGAAAGPGAPRISDFGLAKSLEAGLCQMTAWQTTSGAILGTPSYMAPEQATGSATIGPAADIYALGAILYECLSGRPPFFSATLLETLEQVRSHEPMAPRRLRPGLPRDLETICLKCLHKEPARRYASAQALADDLGRFLRGEAIQARPVSWYERLGKWMRRQPALAGLLVFSICLLIVLIAGGLVYQAHLRSAIARAEAQEEAARQQHELAAGHYRAARATLGQILHRLDQLPPGKIHSREDLKRALMEDALDFYRAVGGADDPDPRVRLDTALAHERVGAFELGVGQSERGAANLRRAIALMEALPDDLRRTAECQDHLADCYIYLGTHASALGQRDETEHCHRQALALRERLVQAEPDNPNWKADVAFSQMLLASGLRHNSARWAEVENLYNQAIVQLAALIETHPGKEVYRLRQASAFTELGHLQRMRQRPERAQESFQKAETLLLPLTRARPQDLDSALALASLYITWSDLLLGSKRPAAWTDLLLGAWSPARAALKRADQAIKLLEPALTQHPEQTGMRALGREAQVKRAAACEALGQWVEAVRSWDRAIALDPATPYLRVQRVRALAWMSAHQQASAEALILAKAATTDAAGLWKLAQALAHCIPAAQSDTRLSRAERQALAERYTAETIALLDRLQASGYFQPEARRQDLAKNRDLRPLRDQPVLRKILGAGK